MLEQARQFRHRRTASRTLEGTGMTLCNAVVEKIKLTTLVVNEVGPFAALCCKHVQIGVIEVAAGAAFEMDDL